MVVECKVVTDKVGMSRLVEYCSRPRENGSTDWLLYRESRPSWCANSNTSSACAAHTTLMMSSGDTPARNIRSSAAPAAEAGSSGFCFQAERTAKQPKPKAPKPPRAKIDPKYLTATRELRDRYLERVNDGSLLAVDGANGKYDVSHALHSPASGTGPPHGCR